MITDDTQRERTAVLLDGFRRELDRLQLGEGDKRSATLWANYMQVVRQLEHELREYDSKSAS